MPKFRRKHTYVEAWQFDGTQAVAEHLTAMSPNINIWPYMGGVGVSIETPEGTMTFAKGDWLVKEGEGLALYKPHVFEQTYEAVKDGK